MPSEAPYLGQHCTSPYPWKERIGRWLWLGFQATLFRLSPRPCHGFRARLLRLFGADIPRPSQVVVFPSVRVEFPNVSQYTHLCAGSHDYRRWSMPLAASPIVIGENVWVAAEVFVGPGVTIGDTSVVGARSVVVSDMPPGKICVGHPCRPVKDRPPPQP